MFQWSVFSSGEAAVPGHSRRSPEEQVTNILMLELASLLKHTERLRQERATELRRRSSCVDYTWLAAPPRSSFELNPGELLELRDLCAKIPPSQCGPVLLRTRKLVTDIEPEVNEVSRIFRSVLCECLDSVEGEEVLRMRAARWGQQRSKSLSFLTFQRRINPLWDSLAGLGASGGTEDPEEDESCSGDEEEGGEAAAGMSRRQRRVRSMPEIFPMEEREQS